MRRLAALVWIGGAAFYAASSLLSIDPSIEHTSPREADVASRAAALNETGVGKTLAEIVQRRSARAPIVSEGAGEPAFGVPSENVIVARPAGAHSEPSVSSPTTYRFPRGKELRVLDRQNGWIQILDPVTKFKGWVLHVYIASPNSDVAQSEHAPHHGEETTAAPLGDAARERPQLRKIKSQQTRITKKRSRPGYRPADEGRVGRKKPAYTRFEPPRSARRANRRKYPRAYADADYPERGYLLPPLALRRYHRQSYDYR